MRSILFLLIHLLTTLAKLLGPGDFKAVLAEILLLKRKPPGHEAIPTSDAKIVARGHRLA